MPFRASNPRSQTDDITITDDSGYTAATITRTGQNWTATRATDDRPIAAGATRETCLANTFAKLDHLLCPHCERSFSTETRLRIHQRRSHPGDTP